MFLNNGKIIFLKLEIVRGFFKIYLISISNTQLVRCYIALAISHYALDNYRTYVSQTGAIGARVVSSNRDVTKIYRFRKDVPTKN